VRDLSDYEKIGVVLKEQGVFDEQYIFICLRPDGPQNTHKKKRLFFTP